MPDANVDMSVNSSQIVLEYFTENPSWILKDISVSPISDNNRYGYLFKSEAYNIYSLDLQLIRRPLYFMIQVLNQPNMK